MFFGLVLIAIVRATLLVTFSYAIAQDSVKTRKALFYCYIAESLLVILYQSYLYYDLDSQDKMVELCNKSKET